MYRGALADAVGFTDDDLAANQAGRLSAGQRASLVRSERNRIALVALCVVLVGLCLVVPALTGVNSLKDVKFLLLALVFTMLGGAVAFSAAQLWRDLQSGAVAQLESFVSSTTKTDSGTANYYWIAGQQRFSVSGDMYTVLEPGRYRLYFLPRSRRIVAAEPSAAATGNDLSPSVHGTS